MNEKTVLFRQVAEQIADLYEAKNSDYGDTFSQTLNKFGFIAAACRLHDKLGRFENLIQSGKSISVKDESLQDTLKDLAAYAIMTVCWASLQTLQDEENIEK